MKITVKLDLLERIGATLQARYTFDDLANYLGWHGCTNLPARGGSKRVFAKQALHNASTQTLREIAEELGIGIVRPDRPEKWKKTDYLRMFISHLSSHKAEARRLRQCMECYAVSGFVAHEDITPTEEWQREMERALATMEVFVSMHRPGFSASHWPRHAAGG